MPNPNIDRILELAPTPSYVVDLGVLRHNLKILDDVQKRSGAKILLALKGYSMWSTFPLIAQTLAGVCASSVWEARLGREEFGKEVHSFSAAYSERDLVALMKYSNHIVFNSFNQLEKFRHIWQPQSGRISFGLRVNPQHSEGQTAIYDPCAPKSRLGIPVKEFEGRSLDGIEGLHFHTLCEQLFMPLKRTADAFEKKFGQYLVGMKWLNLGGGHHITREGYDIDGLVELIKYFRQKFGVRVYLEPGEAVVLGSGVLTTQVLDVVKNEAEIAILDTSVACHMPDVLEMPYRPPLYKGFDPHDKQYAYRLAGPSCLAGDVIGDWSFDKQLKPGDRLAFMDQAHYTMVKNTTFNGIQLPNICTYDPDTDKLTVVRSFEYEDFKNRLS